MTCIEVPKRRPSETGLSSQELSKFIGLLSSRKNVVDKLNEVLAEIRRSTTPIVAFVVAEWGEGKTSLYYVYLDKLRPPEMVSFIVSTRTFIGYLEDVLKGKLFPKSKSPAYTLLASILAALLEEQRHALADKCAGEPSAIDPYSYEDAQQYVNLVLDMLSNMCGKTKVLLFLDEFEDIVGVQDVRVVETIVSGLTHIINGVVKEITTGGKYEGLIHLFISMTPSAYAKLKSFGDIATIIARLGRRIKEIELKPITRDEAIKFIDGLLKYIYDSDSRGILYVFDMPNLVNALIVSTLGNMAALQRAVIEVLHLNEVRNPCNGGMKKIDYNTFLDLIKDVEIYIANASLPIFVYDVYRRIKTVWKDYLSIESSAVNPELALKFLDLVTTSIVLRVEDIERRLGLDRTTIKDLVFKLNILARSPSLGMNIHRFIYNVLTLKLSDDIKTRLLDIVQDILRSLPSVGSEARELAKMFVENLVFIDADGDAVLVLPNINNLAEVKDFVADLLPISLSDVELEKFVSSLAMRVADIIKRQNTNIDYLMLSPKIAGLVYLSPELTFLNFVKDVDRRFRYWRELLAEQTDEFLSLGFIALLSSRPDRLSLKNVEVLG